MTTVTRPSKNRYVVNGARGYPVVVELHLSQEQADVLVAAEKARLLKLNPGNDEFMEFINVGSVVHSAIWRDLPAQP